ncbi:hypothetical protein PYCCODRAFT_1041627 [Trametes coccinea BRFM310]|uniref:Uncharacterized protein n=1 Tax=Trametes coccinea (strain BRFM310) TaxID=1353009 RepID=A0A1Y2IC83_TRAC3|nr:hypothetical protein PYCCODRAFT_1041627 [Trametes coccinea BRFM310]
MPPRTCVLVRSARKLEPCALARLSRDDVAGWYRQSRAIEYVPVCWDECERPRASHWPSLRDSKKCQRIVLINPWPTSECLRMARGLYVRAIRFGDSEASPAKFAAIGYCPADIDTLQQMGLAGRPHSPKERPGLELESQTMRDVSARPHEFTTYLSASRGADPSDCCSTPIW